jgi:ABC-type glycerol-3-phosphate transport system permease component
MTTLQAEPVDVLPDADEGIEDIDEAPRQRSWSPLRLAIAVVLAATYLVPFVFMISVALKPADQFFTDPAAWPRSLTLDHFSYAWDAADLGHALKNSAIAVGIGVVLCCAICSAAAFWFLRHRGRVASVLLAGFGSLWILPQVVWLVPFFLTLTTLHLTNNIFVLGLVYGTVFAPSFIWLLWAYFLQGLPHDILESAEMDGASLFQQYLRIALPLSLPALGAVAALTFVFAWGDLLLAVVLIADPDEFTVVPAAATLVGRLGSGLQETTAAAVITMIPPLAIFLIAQKAIVRGITGGFSK